MKNILGSRPSFLRPTVLRPTVKKQKKPSGPLSFFEEKKVGERVTQKEGSASHV